MDRICKCGNVIVLEGETGTPENYYYGKCMICNRRLTIREHVTTGKETEYWTESGPELEPKLQDENDTK